MPSRRLKILLLGAHKWNEWRAKRKKDQDGSIDFSGVILKDINLSGADLRIVDFSNSILCNVTLANCNLRGCFFKKGTLQNVNFTGSDLSGCDFEGAILIGTDLYCAKEYGYINTRGATIISR